MRGEIAISVIFILDLIFFLVAVITVIRRRRYGGPSPFPPIHFVAYLAIPFLAKTAPFTNLSDFGWQRILISLFWGIMMSAFSLWFGVMLPHVVGDWVCGPEVDERENPQEK